MIGFIPKNSRERLQVEFGSYQGHDFLNIRLHYLKPDGETFGPTPKGVTVKPGQIGDLIELLQRARGEAVQRGLINGGSV